MSDSFLRYWRGLEAIILVKVESVEADLASGLSRTADRPSHGHDQASSLGRRDDPQGATPSTSKPSRHPTARGALRRNDPICHSRKLSIMLTRTHKFVTSTYSVRSITKQANI